MQMEEELLWEVKHFVHFCAKRALVCFDVPIQETRDNGTRDQQVQSAK